MEYHLRDIDPSFWGTVATRAKSEGVTIRGLILILLRAYCANELRLELRRDA